MSFVNQPLGTVISSVLNWQQLCQVMNNENAAFSPGSSSYAPCDGRIIVNSALTKALPSITTAPDLRGRFLRGLNLFLSDGQPPLVIDVADPDGLNRTSGSYQSDALLTHNHSASGTINGPVSFSNMTHDVDGGGDKWNSDPTLHDKSVSVTVNNYNGGKETRPRNVAVYYYIKIN